MAEPRPRITYANVAATLALALALSGGAYAAEKLPKNSVASKQIKDGQVKSADVQDNGVTGADVDEGSLEKVPSAASADSATTAGDAAKLGGIASSSYAQTGSDGWTAAAAFNDGTYGGLYPAKTGCYWDKYDVGTTYPTAGYYRDPFGTVHLRGMVKANNGTGAGIGGPGAGDCGQQGVYDVLVLTLPAGYRPEFRAILPATSNDAPGRVDVLPDGTVKIEANYPSYVNARGWLSLDGLTFRCAPAGSGGCP